MSAHISNHQVHHIAKLASIPVTSEEESNLAAAFDETLQVVEKLKTVDVSQVVATSQVTGLENVFRADEIKPELMFTQDQALANATQTYQGYFVVPQLIDQGE